MFQANMTLEERMSRATVAWMRKEPALAGVLMIGETYLEKTRNGKEFTACTNGRDEWYCRAFMEALNDAQLWGAELVRQATIVETHHLEEEEE